MTETKDIDPVIQYAFYDELIFKAYPELSHLTFEQIHRQLGNVSKEILLEVAISKVGKLTRYNTKGMDYTDKSDAKAASARWTSSRSVYSAPITNVFHKQGLLRIMVFERQHNKFYYFLIPHHAYKDIPEKSNIEIYFELDGTPRRSAKTKKYMNMWAYEVADFNGILSDTAPFPWSYIDSINRPQLPLLFDFESMSLRVGC